MPQQRFNDIQTSVVRGKHERRLSVPIKRIDVDARTKLLFNTADVSKSCRTLEFRSHRFKSPSDVSALSCGHPCQPAASCQALAPVNPNDDCEIEFYSARFPNVLRRRSQAPAKLRWRHRDLMPPGAILFIDNHLN